MTLEATDEARPDEPEQHQCDPVLMRTVAAAAAQARLLRTVLADWGRACGLPDELIADLVLASYEALANVVEHAYPASADGTMRLVARRSAGRVTVTISDTGQWREAASPPGRGHGLRLIRALAPDTTLTTSPTGTTVRLTWLQGSHRRARPGAWTR
ncbi:ATP-binding protein [Prauserella sp. PE36]|uniref:ATP-binding protein n=1 Tax=Prauserella sp. PE36 TaxID=1504709 RepID=UPI000DE4152A|nr:ATP-binding protein [Prauserella sp. PE36]RBM17956.1 ATP-binding protein [Prauserella sp. PE36]